MLKYLIPGIPVALTGVMLLIHWLHSANKISKASAKDWMFWLSLALFVSSAFVVFELTKNAPLGQVGRSLVSLSAGVGVTFLVVLLLFLAFNRPVKQINP